jgi:WD40 repeat protein
VPILLIDHVDLVLQSWLVTEQVESTKGHIESIVSFTSVDHIHDSSRKFLIATGRDKRITVWDVDLTSKSKVISFQVQLLMISSGTCSDSNKSFLSAFSGKSECPNKFYQSMCGSRIGSDRCIMDT